MIINHEVYTLSNTVPTLISIDPSYAFYNYDITIQNIDSAAHVVIGNTTATGESLSLTSFAIKILPNETFEYKDLGKGSDFYAMSNVNGTKISMLKIIDPSLGQS